MIHHAHNTAHLGELDRLQRENRQLRLDNQRLETEKRNLISGVRQLLAWNRSLNTRILEQRRAA